MTNPQFVLVLTTVANTDQAQQLANLALQQRLAACVNIIPGLTSCYRWQGKIETATELQLIFKTTTAAQQALFTLLEQHHPYQTPELLSLPIVAGSAAYLAWLQANTIGTAEI